MKKLSKLGIHEKMKFEDNASSDIDLNAFDLKIEFLNNIFDGKKIIDKDLIERENLELFINCRIVVYWIVFLNKMIIITY